MTPRFLPTIGPRARCSSWFMMYCASGIDCCVPPYSSGKPIESQPRSAIFVMNACRSGVSSRPPSQCDFTSSVISAAMNSRTSVRKASSSSLNRKFMGVSFGRCNRIRPSPRPPPPRASPRSPPRRIPSSANTSAVFAPGATPALRMRPGRLRQLHHHAHLRPRGVAGQLRLDDHLAVAQVRVAHHLVHRVHGRDAGLGGHQLATPIRRGSSCRKISRNAANISSRFAPSSCWCGMKSSRPSRRHRFSKNQGSIAQTVRYLPSLVS